MSAWSSYDAIAEEYAAVAEPAYFARPAADLVKFLRPRPGMRVLDIGCGSGAVAAAAERFSSGLKLVCVDVSLPMLLFARKQIGTASFLVGSLPNMPCRKSSFDVVVAAFLLSHIHEREHAVIAMSSLLRPGGILGLSSWARSPSATAAGEAWQEIAAGFIEPELLQKAMDSALPRESELSSPEALASVLRAADLRSVRTEQHSYDVALSTDAFIQSRLLGIGSRFMRTVLVAEKWDEFRSAVRRRLFDVFGPELKFEVSVNFAAGTVY